MKNLFLLCLLLFCFLGQTQKATAQCSSYSSIYPPPYPETFPCMSDFLSTFSYCCDEEFDLYCWDQMNQFCDILPPSFDNIAHCFVNQCSPTGCSPKLMPHCNTDDLICSNYLLEDLSLHPPGPNPPFIPDVNDVDNNPYTPLIVDVDAGLLELFLYDGDCCGNHPVTSWATGFDPLCWNLLDSLNCYPCNDNDPNTIDGVSPILGCTHTPLPQGVPNVVAKIKVMLEGAYVGDGQMRTDLRDRELLPASQPFGSAPWNYSGAEGVANTTMLPATAVDWVLVEIRSPLDYDITVGYAAGILLSDGRIVDVDYATSGTDGLTFAGLYPNTNYYIIVRSRNHLDVMSAMPVFLPNPSAYDFSSNAGNTRNFDIVNQSQTKFFDFVDFDISQLGDEFEVHVLRAGDVNVDGAIDINDFTDVDAHYAQASTINSYVLSDVTCDGHVTYTDFNRYASNLGIGAIAPVLIQANPVSPIPTCP